MLLQCSMLNTALHIAASYSGYLVPRTHWKPHLLRINPVNSICPSFISQLLSMGAFAGGLAQVKRIMQWNIITSIAES